MIGFYVPCTDPASGGSCFYSFDVERGSVLFAGSRDLIPDERICSDLISAFGQLGFSFLTGCAKGVDMSFRKAMGDSEFREICVMACAFPERARFSFGIHPVVVSPQGISPRAALARRTLWMTDRCKMAVVFPSSPIGKGSRLAIKSAIMGGKPVFVVSETRPKESDLYTVLPSSLFGIVKGFWCVPFMKDARGFCSMRV